MQLCEYLTNVACVLFGSEDKIISTKLQTLLDFDTALAYISINKSMNLSTLSFRITDVLEDYKEELQRTSIEKGWKVSRTLVAFYFEIDFRLAKINISLVGRGRISNKVFIEVTG